MELSKILSNEASIRENFKELAKIYAQQTGKKVNFSCPSCVNLVVLTLKRKYMISGNFLINPPQAIFRTNSGKQVKNGSTDEVHLQFLRENPEREIRYSKLPADWKERIKLTAEKAEVKDAAVAEKMAVDSAREIEALRKEIKNLKAENEKLKAVNSEKKEEGGQKKTPVKVKLTAEEEAEKAANEAIKK